MKKRTVFDKKYPLFVKYIDDVNIQENMVVNEDLYRKYNANKESINVFLMELDKHFDTDTIKNIIIETVVKLPDNVLVSIIKSYLASEEESKSNMQFIMFYNRTSNYGKESIEYIENHGIVTNRRYREIPMLALDEKYERIKTGNESFKGLKLDSYYNMFNLAEKKFVIDLIENDVFDALDLIFERLNFTLPAVIKLLIQKGFNKDILNLESIQGVEPYYLMIMVCQIIELDDSIRAMDAIKKLFALKSMN